jgi:DMSO/TMAO reductase YedYZ molybdopterin-dependent catalytic subunit
MNIQNYYAFGFFFTDAHYYGAWVFIAALTLHVSLKFSTMRRSLATRRVLSPLLEDIVHTAPELSESDLVARSPAAPTMTRRALLGMVGAGSALLFVQGAGQWLGGPLRAVAFLAPRGRNPGSGPNGFQINKAFAATGLEQEQLGTAWRLQLHGRRALQLSREQLLAMPQHTYELPIACVEGWTTTQRWTGVRLRDLAALAGIDRQAQMTANTLEQGFVYDATVLSTAQVADERSLLALRVNGAELSLDHGYPARVIGPALPGVHCTKWVGTLSFRSA